jgi:hypothetical protein
MGHLPVVNRKDATGLNSPCDFRAQEVGTKITWSVYLFIIYFLLHFYTATSTILPTKKTLSFSVPLSVEQTRIEAT